MAGLTLYDGALCEPPYGTRFRWEPAEGAPAAIEPLAMLVRRLEVAEPVVLWDTGLVRWRLDRTTREGARGEAIQVQGVQAEAAALPGLAWLTEAPVSDEAHDDALAQRAALLTRALWGAPEDPITSSCWALWVSADPVAAATRAHAPLPADLLLITPEPLHKPLSQADLRLARLATTAPKPTAEALALAALLGSTRAPFAALRGDRAPLSLLGATLRLDATTRRDAAEALAALTALTPSSPKTPSPRQTGALIRWLDALELPAWTVSAALDDTITAPALRLDAAHLSVRLPRAGWDAEAWLLWRTALRDHKAARDTLDASLESLGQPPGAPLWWAARGVPSLLTEAARQQTPTLDHLSPQHLLDRHIVPASQRASTLRADAQAFDALHAWVRNREVSITRDNLPLLRALHAEHADAEARRTLIDRTPEALRDGLHDALGLTPPPAPAPTPTPAPKPALATAPTSTPEPPTSASAPTDRAVIADTSGATSSTSSTKNPHPLAIALGAGLLGLVLGLGLSQLIPGPKPPELPDPYSLDTPDMGEVEADSPDRLVLGWDGVERPIHERLRPTCDAWGNLTLSPNDKTLITILCSPIPAADAASVPRAALCVEPTRGCQRLTPALLKAATTDATPPAEHLKLCHPLTGAPMTVQLAEAPARRPDKKKPADKKRPPTPPPAAFLATLVADPPEDDTCLPAPYKDLADTTPQPPPTEKLTTPQKTP